MHCPSIFVFFALFCSYFVYCSSANCHKKTVVDIMFAIDSTGSMRSSLSTIKTVLPTLLTLLKRKYFNSRFGLILYNWKPNGCPVVFGSNACPSIIQDLTSDETVLLSALRNITTSGGSVNGEQDTLGAMLVAALNDNIGWETNKEKDVQRLRVVVIMTDAMYSLPNSVESCSENNDSYVDIKGKYSDNDGDGDYQCDKEDFPSVKQISAAFKKQKIFPLFLIANRMEHLYTALLSEMGIKGAVRDIQTDSSDIVDKLPSAIETFACSSTTTTTTSTVTTTPFTTSTVTTTPFTTSTVTTTPFTTSTVTTTLFTTSTVTTTVVTTTTEDASTETTSNFSTTTEEDEAKFPILGIAIGAALGGLLIVAAMTAILMKRSKSSQKPLDPVFESWSVDMSTVDKNVAASVMDNAFI